MKKIVDFTVKYPVLITVIICIVFYFLPFKPKPFGDGEYHLGTIQLIDYIKNGFSGYVQVDKGLFTLFYYLIPYSIARIFNTDSAYLFFGIVFNLIMICIAIQYLFKCLTILKCDKKTKFYIIILLNLFPIHIYYSYGILAETIAFLSSCTLIYGWLKINNTVDVNKKHIFLIVFSAIALIGCRPNLIPFILLFFGYILFTKLPKKVIVSMSFFISFFLMVIIEKQINTQKNDFKEVVFRNQILWSRFELRKEPFNWIPQHGRDAYSTLDYWDNLNKRAELDSITTRKKIDKTSYVVSWVLNDIKENPTLTIRQYFLKFFQSQSFIISPLIKSNKPAIIKYGVHIYINLINYIILFLAMFGLVKLYKQKMHYLFMFALLFWGYSYAYICFFHSEQRYMFPLRPVLIMLSAFLLSNFNIKHLKKTT